MRTHDESETFLLSGLVACVILILLRR